MAKRKVTFLDPEEGEGEEEEPLPPRKRATVAVGGPGSRFSGKPSLDSDEEDDDEEDEEGCGKYNLLAAHDIEGQEAGPAQGGEGEPPLTPFNLEEELAEGSFDPHGNYVRRGRPRPPDPWLEGVDWASVKARPPPPRAAAARSPSPPALPPLLRGALELLRPGETVGGALRRLGGAAAGRGRGRGRGRGGPSPQLEALAELADGLVARGLFGVFQETRERLRRRLRALGGAAEGRGEGGGGHAPAGATPPPPRPALDIFAPDEEEGEEEEEEGGGEEEEEEEGQRQEEGAEPLPEVLWEYKWEHEGDPHIYGPFSSAQMQEWAAQGYFAGGARCRRVHPQGPFYDCARVDFQLYT